MPGLALFVTFPPRLFTLLFFSSPVPRHGHALPCLSAPPVSLFPGLYTCEVDFADLARFDVQLADELRNNPSELLPIMEAAAKSVVLRSLVGNQRDSDLHDIQIQVIGFNRFVSLRELRSDLVSRMVAVSGIVVSSTRASTKATGITLQCRNCKAVRRVPVNEGFGGARVPRQCDHVPLNPDEERCPLDPYTIMADACAFVDTQVRVVVRDGRAVCGHQQLRIFQSS